MDARRRHALVPYVLVPLLLLGYVLSYAPAFRLACGQGNGKCPMGGPLGVYRPVDWLIDHTPFEQPLLTWARICGVESDFSRAKGIRRASRTVDLDIPYPQGSFFAVW